MSTNQNTLGKMSNYRWTICAMLFFATTVNYLDRQVLSLTWKDFIAPEFHWTDADYGDITAVFSIVYAIANLFAGRFIDWLGTKKGYLWAIFVWSLGACLHAVCGWATEHVVGIHDAAAMISATGAVASTIAITSVYFFIAARVILSVGEAGNFPAAIKVTAELTFKLIAEICCVIIQKLNRVAVRKSVSQINKFSDKRIQLCKLWHTVNI